MISAYPEIDFALARYHQDQGLRRSCQTAKWFECQGLIGTYDNPTDNTGAVACTVQIGPAAGDTVTVHEVSTAGDECINYAGTCGPPRRGADILSGFGTPTRDLVRWLDERETAFYADATPGDVCRHSSGGDCELRASGQTPLGGALQATEDYVVPIRTTDAAAMCRTYSIILVTDGAESCEGDPVAEATRLHDTYAIDTYVIAVSVLPEEEASLNAIASAGSGGARATATFVRNPADLVPALTSIIEARSAPSDATRWTTTATNWSTRASRSASPATTAAWARAAGPVPRCARPTSSRWSVKSPRPVCRPVPSPATAWTTTATRPSTKG